VDLWLSERGRPSLCVGHKCRAAANDRSFQSQNTSRAKAVYPRRRVSDPRSWKSPIASCRGRVIWDCASGSRSAVYWHAVLNPNKADHHIYLDYWVFYRYNEFSVPRLCMGWLCYPAKSYDLHAGDWEGMTVAVNSQNMKVDWVGYAQHSKNVSYSASQLKCSGQSGQGLLRTCNSTSGFTRPVGYVATGSHATYPTSCPYKAPKCSAEKVNSNVNDYLKAPETTRNGRSAWWGNTRPGSWKPLRIHGWSDWKGNWNSTSIKVQSPLNTSRGRSFHPWSAFTRH